MFSSLQWSLPRLQFGLELVLERRTVSCNTRFCLEMLMIFFAAGSSSSLNCQEFFHQWILGWRHWRRISLWRQSWRQLDSDWSVRYRLGHCPDHTLYIIGVTAIRKTGSWQLGLQTVKTWSLSGRQCSSVGKFRSVPCSLAHQQFMFGNSFVKFCSDVLLWIRRVTGYVWERRQELSKMIEC